MQSNAFLIRLEGNETFSNAAEGIVLNRRAAIAESSCSWCTEVQFSWGFMDSRSLVNLLSAFVLLIHGPHGGMGTDPVERHA